MQQYTEKSTSYDENKKSFIGENEKSSLKFFLNRWAPPSQRSAVWRDSRAPTPAMLSLPSLSGIKKNGTAACSNCVNFSQPTSRVDAQVSHVIGRSQVNPSSSPNKNAIASSSHFRRLTNMRRIRTSNMRKRQIGQDPRLQKRLYYCVIWYCSKCCTAPGKESVINWAWLRGQCFSVFERHERSAGWGNRNGGVWRKDSYPGGHRNTCVSLQ